jgi:hypothetical protein
MTTQVPPINDPCWLRLAKGGLGRMKTQHLGTQLMTKRLERSSASETEKANEIHAFFTRWERALPSEVAQLPRL